MSDGPIRDGDVLPMLGGPHDGAMRRVDFVLPFLGGGVPPSMMSFGDHFYLLDHDRRAWVYVPLKEQHDVR